MKAIFFPKKSPILLIGIFILSLFSQPVFADTAAEIDKEVKLALEKLYAGSPTAVEFSKVCKGILVYPDVVKAGLIIGGQYGGCVSPDYYISDANVLADNYLSANLHVAKHLPANLLAANFWLPISDCQFHGCQSARCQYFYCQFSG